MVSDNNEDNAVLFRRRFFVHGRESPHWITIFQPELVPEHGMWKCGWRIEYFDTRVRDSYGPDALGSVVEALLAVDTVLRTEGKGTLQVYSFDHDDGARILNENSLKKLWESDSDR